MEIANKIVSAVKAGIQELYGTEVSESMIQLQETRPEFEGQLTVVVFPFLKISRKKPEDTAQDLGTFLKTQIPEIIQDFNVIKGFLNLTIQPSQWIDLLLDIQQQEHFGFVPVTEDSPLVMIEYSSPNTNKPLHLGHVRNNLLGWALANVMQANGNKVVKTNIVNDRGIHICKSMLAWQYYGNGETPESSGKKGDHLIGDYYVAFDQHYREQVKELVEKAQGETEILIAGGVDASVLPMLAEKTKAKAYHMSGKISMESEMRYRKQDVSMGVASVSEYEIWRTSEKRVREARKVLEQL